MLPDSVLTIQDVEALAIPPLQKWCMERAQLMAPDKHTADMYAWQILIFLTGNMHHPSVVWH